MLVQRFVSETISRLILNRQQKSRALARQRRNSISVMEAQTTIANLFVSSCHKIEGPIIAMNSAYLSVAPYHQRTSTSDSDL